MEPSHPLRILVVEDYAPMREVVLALLELLGHSVVVASSAAEAIAASRAEAFDLILMDVRMPGMGGLEAAARIRVDEAASGHRAVILEFTTARAGDHSAPREEAGMDGHVSKFDVAGLEEALGQVGRVPMPLVWTSYRAPSAN